MQRTGKTGRSGAGGSREQTDGAARVWCWGARCQLWGWEDGDGVRGEGFLPPFPLLVSHEGFWQSPQKGVAAPGSHVVLQNLGGRGAWWAGSLPHRVLPYLFTCVTPPTCSLGWILKCTAFTPMTSTWLQLHGGPGGGDTGVQKATTGRSPAWGAGWCSHQHLGCSWVLSHPCVWGASASQLGLR